MTLVIGALVCLGMAGYFYFRAIQKDSLGNAALLLLFGLAGLYQFSIAWIDGGTNLLNAIFQSNTPGVGRAEKIYLAIGFTVIFFFSLSAWAYLRPDQTHEQQAFSGTCLCMSMGVGVGLLIGADANSLPAGTFAGFGTAAVGAFILKNY